MLTCLPICACRAACCLTLCFHQQTQLHKRLLVFHLLCGRFRPCCTRSSCWQQDECSGFCHRTFVVWFNHSRMHGKQHDLLWFGTNMAMCKTSLHASVHACSIFVEFCQASCLQATRKIGCCIMVQDFMLFCLELCTSVNADAQSLACMSNSFSL